MLKFFPEIMVKVEWNTIICKLYGLYLGLCIVLPFWQCFHPFTLKNTLMFNMVQCSILIEKICCIKSVFQVSSFVANLGEATARKFTLEGFLWR